MIDTTRRALTRAARGHAMTPADALRRIRMDQKTERYLLPKSAETVLGEVLNGKLVSPLFLRPWPASVRRSIRRHWDAIHHDTIFGYSRQRLTGRYTASTVLSLLCHLLQQRIEAVLDDTTSVIWPEVTVESPSLAVHTTAAFTTSYGEQTYTGVVPGQTRIVCTARYRGRDVAVFDRFITHPFFQYSARESFAG